MDDLTQAIAELRELYRRLASGPNAEWHADDDGFVVNTNGERVCDCMPGINFPPKLGNARARLIAIEHNALPSLLDEIGRLHRVEQHARAVMGLLEKHGPSIVPHLLDTDDNPGQRLREAMGEGEDRE
jgi:hypothetical protein